MRRGGATARIADHEAEKELLGMALIDPVRGAALHLAADDFDHPSHVAIWEAVQALRGDEAPVDASTVSDRLRSSDSLTIVGGLDYLKDLVGRVVTTESIKYWEHRVRSLADRRRVAALGEDMRRAAYTDEDAPELAERFARHLEELRDRSHGRRPVTLRASEIPIVRVEWVWHGRIAAGMINLLDGDPGLGKSTITTDLAARITRGKALPGDEDGDAAPPAGVVIISFEEHPGAVMAPRLQAAGADLARVMIWNLAERPFNIVDSLSDLRREMEQHQARLVIIDPFVAALPSGLSANHDQDVRAALAPVAALAETTKAAVLLIRHLNKATGGSALSRGAGSIGIVGAARCGMLLARDPEREDDEAARVIAMTKCNVARMAPALGLRLVPAPSPAPGVEVARVEWTGAARSSADDLVGDRDESSARAEAESFLRHVLSDGPVTVVKLQDEAEEAGLKWRTLERAKQRLRIRSSKTTAGPWMWAMPEKQ